MGSQGFSSNLFHFASLGHIPVSPSTKDGIEVVTVDYAGVTWSIPTCTDISC